MVGLTSTCHLHESFFILAIYLGLDLFTRYNSFLIFVPVEVAAGIVVDVVVVVVVPDRGCTRGVDVYCSLI